MKSTNGPDIDSLAVLLLFLYSVGGCYYNMLQHYQGLTLLLNFPHIYRSTKPGITLLCQGASVLQGYVGMNRWQLQNEPAAAVSSPLWGGKASIPLVGQRCTLHFSIWLEMMQVSTHFRGHLDRKAAAGWLMCDISVHAGSHMKMNVNIWKRHHSPF